MKVSISNLAQLSKLNLSSTQSQTMEESIPSVVKAMEEIKNLSVPDVTATNGVTEEVNIYREDVVEPSFSQDEALKNAKNTYNGFFVVPYVFEEGQDATQ